MLGGFGVGLTLAHQAFKQLDRDLLGVILGNVGARIFYPAQEDAAAIAARLGGPARKEDQLYLERFWTTQALPMASWLLGSRDRGAPAARAGRGHAGPRAAGAAQRAGGSRGAPLGPRHGRGGRSADRRLARPGRPRGRAKRRRRAGPRLCGLVEALYGAERDDQVAQTLCALSADDFGLYRRARRIADQRLRAQILAHRRLFSDTLDEAAKLARVALLSDLQYGAPPVEARAQVARVLGAPRAADPERAFADGAPARRPRAARAPHEGRGAQRRMRAAGPGPQTRCRAAHDDISPRAHPRGGVHGSWNPPGGRDRARRFARLPRAGEGPGPRADGARPSPDAGAASAVRALRQSRGAAAGHPGAADVPDHGADRRGVLPLLCARGRPARPAARAGLRGAAGPALGRARASAGRPAAPAAPRLLRRIGTASTAWTGWIRAVSRTGTRAGWRAPGPPRCTCSG